MKARLVTVAAALALIYGLPVAAGDAVARFEGGIGMNPELRAGFPNFVRGVMPGGRIWRIQALKARVRRDGSIVVKGEGLLLAGSDQIGSRDFIANVKATLLCGSDSFDSHYVPLSATGDFEIRDVSNPVPPATCDAPVLLIRAAELSDAWIAAGVPAAPDE